MSFQAFQSFEARYDVVVCDLCGTYGAVGDSDWREVRAAADGHARHLCRECGRRAVWCAIHDSYHLPDSNHRRPCIGCGGLFTARVSEARERCPSCQRALRLAQQPAANGQASRHRTFWKWK